MTDIPKQEWPVIFVDDFAVWLRSLDHKDLKEVMSHIEMVRLHGPALGEPVVKPIKGTSLPGMREVRCSQWRLLFVFDPARRAIMLVGGNKYKRWKIWYEENIPIAEDRYRDYVKANPLPAKEGEAGAARAKVTAKGKKR